jgi:Ca-activated chloride channel family protein
MTKDSAANIIFEQAAEQFEVASKSTLNTDTMQRAFHNLGNSKLFQSNYEDAISAYKKALKLNPKDEDTRYNLAFAQRQLKKQQDQQKKDGDKKEDKGEKDKEKINNKNDKEKQEAAQPKMSKEQAEQMLNALKNDEKKMQSLRKKKGEPGQKKKVEKDW